MQGIPRESRVRARETPDREAPMIRMGRVVEGVMGKGGKG